MYTNNLISPRGGFIPENVKCTLNLGFTTLEFNPHLTHNLKTLITNNMFDYYSKVLIHDIMEIAESSGWGLCGYEIYSSKSTYITFSRDTKAKLIRVSSHPRHPSNIYRTPDLNFVFPFNITTQDLKLAFK